jgi:hypothetical protein
LDFRKGSAHLWSEPWLLALDRGRQLPQRISRCIWLLRRSRVVGSFALAGISLGNELPLSSRKGRFFFLADGNRQAGLAPGEAWPLAAGVVAIWIEGDRSLMQPSGAGIWCRPGYAGPFYSLVEGRALRTVIDHYPEQDASTGRLGDDATGNSTIVQRLQHAFEAQLHAALTRAGSDSCRRTLSLYGQGRVTVPSRVLRPMSEFDPSEPAILHDRRNDRTIAWSPAFEWEFKRYARQHAPGVIAFEGLLLDGWRDVEDRALN